MYNSFSLQTPSIFVVLDVRGMLDASYMASYPGSRSWSYRNMDGSFSVEWIHCQINPIHEVHQTYLYFGLFKTEKSSFSFWKPSQVDWSSVAPLTANDTFGSTRPIPGNQGLHFDQCWAPYNAFPNAQKHHRRSVYLMGYLEVSTQASYTPESIAPSTRISLAGFIHSTWT